MAGDRIVVRMQRSGGIAGFTLNAQADSDRLDPAEREQLERLLGQAELGTPPAPPRGADRFQYDLEVERDGHVERATAYDGSMAPGLKALTDWLAAPPPKS